MRSLAIPTTRSLIVLLAFTPLVSSTCFLPNGTANPSPGAAPCSTDPTNPLSAVCCNTKWSNPPGGDLKFGQPQDECMPNGLCMNRGMSTKVGEERPPWRHFYRVYVTEEGGGVGVCDSGLNADSVVQMTPCDGTPTSEKWCCGNKSDCCDVANAHRAVYVPRKLGDSKIPPTSFSAPVSAASASTSGSGSASGSAANPTAPAAADADASNSSTSQQSTGANDADSSNTTRKIALGVGIGLGVPFLLALGVVLGMFVLKRKEKGKEGEVAEVGNSDEMGMGMGEGSGQARVKRQDTDQTMELETPVSELWGDGRLKAELE